ncbi:MAG: CYTH domain-containing protein, partial [Rhodospirillales bacterium]|nr:CYTH domain-containing protein [Rhodospirillales bacterium]
MAQPTTLRLEISPEDSARLLRLAAVAGPSPRRPTTRRLAVTYFDTPDRQLRSAGVVLEIRRSGRRHVQIVRVAGTMVDGERINRDWENPLATAEPDPSAVDDIDLRRLITPLPGLRLEPVLRLDLRRISRRLMPAEDQEILVTVHTGEAEDGTAVPAFCEVVLTLRAGPPVLLFDLARAIHTEIPLRVATEPFERRAL